MEAIQVEEPVYENLNSQKKRILTIIKERIPQIKTVGAVIASIFFIISVVIYIHGHFNLPSDSPELKAREEKVVQALQNLVLLARIQEESTERLRTDQSGYLLSQRPLRLGVDYYEGHEGVLVPAEEWKYQTIINASKSRRFRRTTTVAYDNYQ